MTKHVLYLSGHEEDEVKLLGRRIRMARQRRVLTQSEVAERAGLARATIVALESGRAGVSLGALVSVMSALGLQGKLAGALERDDIGEEIEMSSRKRVRKQDLVADF